MHPHHDVNGELIPFEMNTDIGQLPLSLCCVNTEVDQETNEAV